MTKAGTVFKSRLAALTVLALIARPSLGYVTSATLEFSNTQPAKIYLNGVLIENEFSKQLHYEDYSLISSADNVFPLKVLNYGQKNVLAFEQSWVGSRDKVHRRMGLSYRLTLKQSSGPTIILLSEPGDLKLRHLTNAQASPEGWTRPDFDDSRWETPTPARLLTRTEEGWAQLVLPNAKGLLGEELWLSFLAHNNAGNAGLGDKNIFRHAFFLPTMPGLPRIMAQPSSGEQGDKISVRVLPDRDSAAMGDFKIGVAVPPGIAVSALGPGASRDPSSGTLSWTYRSAAKTLALHLNAVVENNGFVLPERAFGGWLPDKIIQMIFRRGISEDDYWDSAAFSTGASACYKMSAPPFKDGAGSPLILDVTFQSELASQQRNRILLNYSVDGTKKGFLPGKGVNVSNSLSPDKWVNGYYDATRDRDWTWGDLEKLRVSFEAQLAGPLALENRLLRCIVSVRYFDPLSVSPYFYATVTESGCRSISLSALVSSLDNNLSSIARISIPVNSSKCPTPMALLERPATAVPTLAPSLPPLRPTATPRPGDPAAGSDRIFDVSSSPEPFKSGGVYISFTLKNAGQGLAFVVYDESGKLQVQKQLGDLAAGKNRFFYDGSDGRGRSLRAGKYGFEIKGMVGGMPQQFRHHFRKVD